MREQDLKRIRLRRRVRGVRKKLFGTPERPRLAVSRSNRGIYAQVIDDATGATLCSASSHSKDLRGELGAQGGNTNAAKRVGQALGAKARSLGIEQVCFDRRGRRFHGRIKALADAAREAGLKF